MAQQGLAQLPEKVRENICTALGTDVLGVEYTGRRFFKRHCGTRVYQFRIPVYAFDYDVVLDVCGQCDDVQKRTEAWMD